MNHRIKLGNSFLLFLTKLKGNRQCYNFLVHDCTYGEAYLGINNKKIFSEIIKKKHDKLEVRSLPDQLEVHV